jgi:hypothetical protein
MFESMIVVVFQNVLHLKMYQNDVFFLIFKKLFLTPANQNDQKIYKKLILNKKIQIFMKRDFNHIPKHYV